MMYLNKKQPPKRATSFNSQEAASMSFHNEEKMKEELDRKLERDILDNVDINFIFNKGANLAGGLIDEVRIFSVMTKLKELAYK